MLEFRLENFEICLKLNYIKIRKFVFLFLILWDTKCQNAKAAAEEEEEYILDSIIEDIIK